MRMFALTVRQPWATLISSGAKRYECRGWPPPRRLLGEPLAIHAGLARLPKLMPPAITDTVVASGPVLSHLPRGTVTCVTRVVGAYRIGTSHTNGHIEIDAHTPGSPPTNRIIITPSERHFIDQEAETWLWDLSLDYILRQPIPALGRQGLWWWQGPVVGGEMPPP